MGMRIFCDNCGNTIQKATKFKFGPDPRYIDDDDEDEVGQPQKRQARPPHLKSIVIDLCDICAPIWMDRVKKLTSASDPNV